MDGDGRLQIGAIIILACFSIYFALVETAFSSASRTKLKAKQERGDLRAKKAIQILDNFEKAITTILIGTNITQISIGAIVTVMVNRVWGLSFVTIATILTAFATFFLADMLPKSIAKRYSEQFCLQTASSLSFFMFIFTPASYIVTKIGAMAAKIRGKEQEISVTEDELYDIIEDMTDGGALDSVRGELVSSALQFADLTAETVLTARVDTVAIDADWDSARILEQIKTHKHSRFPVYEGSIDNVIGVLQIRKYIKEYLRIQKAPEVRALLDAAYFVHGSIKINELLSVMSGKKLNMAIVTDNYGGTLGIVTVEDIIEELVGEIWDEDDIVEESFMPIGGGRYEVDAELTVGEVFDRLEFCSADDIEDFEHKLMGEWVYEQFGQIPEERSAFVFGDVEISISSMRNNRILKLTLRKLPEADKRGGEEQ